MTTLKNINIDLPKDIGKKKKIPLYKAWLKENGDELKVDVNIDIYSLTPEEAIERVIRSTLNNLKDKIVAVIVFKFPKEELYNKDLVDHGDVFKCPSGLSFSMTIKDKLYDLELELYQIVSYDEEFIKDTEEKIIKNLVINKL